MAILLRLSLHSANNHVIILQIFTRLSFCPLLTFNLGTSDIGV